MCVGRWVAACVGACVCVHCVWYVCVHCVWCVYMCVHVCVCVCVCAYACMFVCVLWTTHKKWQEHKSKHYTCMCTHERCIYCGACVCALCVVCVCTVCGVCVCIRVHVCVCAADNTHKQMARTQKEALYIWPTVKRGMNCGMDSFCRLTGSESML